MIHAMNLRELATALRAVIQGGDASADNVTFARVNTDTRSIAGGDLFVALKGERFDAHDFLATAAAAGAVAAVVERVDNSVDLPQLLVKDSTRALGEIAHLQRLQYQGPLVALTGSCGKTTVKEMIATVLQQKAPVLVTRGNLNNHIGVPQTLLTMQADARYAVIEMGASGLGEIDYLAGLAEPTVALVNNVMAAHLQGFGSEAGVAAEKSTIYRHLRENGTAVINLDEPYAAGWLATLQQTRPDVRLLTFSDRQSEADVTATDISLNDQGRYEFMLHAGDDSVRVQLPMMGRQNVNNALAVAACCLAVGASLQEIAAGLGKVQPVKGRMLPRQGVHQSLVIDDTYNANPGSVKAAARLLLDLQSAGRDVILVLGDLGELGAGEAVTLTGLGEDLQAMGVPYLITQGNNSLHASNGFKAGMQQQQRTRHFVSKDELNAFLTTQLTDNTVVLVKGSRSAGMESVVQAITLGGENQ